MLNARAKRHGELRQNGSFNHRADTVTAEVFKMSDFFDEHDMMQVKYEMLRAVAKEKKDVTSTSERFGFSRVSFYQIKKEFDTHGVVGLMPKKRGPKGSRKLTADDVEYAKTLVDTHTKAQIVRLLYEERGVEISKRTLERQLKDKKNP